MHVAGRCTALLLLVCFPAGEGPLSALFSSSSCSTQESDLPPTSRFSRCWEPAAAPVPLGYRLCLILARRGAPVPSRWCRTTEATSMPFSTSLMGMRGE